MGIEIRTVSGYNELDIWTRARNEVGSGVFTTELAALIRATELGRVDLIAVDGDDPVGIAFVSADPVSRESGRAFVDVKVPERHRGRGVGSALLRAASGHARELGVSMLRCSAREDDPQSVAFLERRGFRVWWRMPRMVLELDSAEQDAAPVPAGVEVAWLADCGDAPLAGMYEVARATYPDCPGMRAGYARSEREWRLYDLADPLVRLDLTAVAFVDGAVVGYSILEEIPGRPIFEHPMVAVAPDRRRSGIGSCLLGKQAAAARSLGVTALMTTPLVDSMLRFYERCGYEPRTCVLGFEGPLVSS